MTVLLGSVLIVMGVLYTYFEEESAEQLKNEAVYAAAGVETGGQEYLDSISENGNDVRITLIESDGTVIYDSVKDAESMENHGKREEVRNAMESGEAQACDIPALPAKKRFIMLCVWKTEAFCGFREHRFRSGFSFAA